MPIHNVNLTISTNAQNLADVNEQLSKMKFIIGLILAKLQPQERDNFIMDLKNFGLTEEAELFANFNPKVE